MPTAWLVQTLRRVREGETQRFKRMPATPQLLEGSFVVPMLEHGLGVDRMVL